MSLNQVTYRLNFLGPDTLAAINCVGVNLRAAAGRLCLLQVAVRDGTGLHCFLIDVMQLTDQFHNLRPFLTNPHTLKLIHDADLHATVLAHKFGVTLAGVIDTHCACEMLSGSGFKGICEFVEWCGMSMASAKQGAMILERSPEMWAHRPLDNIAQKYAA